MSDVIIVGAGLAGLACARRLLEIGKSFVVVEASDGVGGRMRTDLLDGYRLDRGFQVLLTSYPECRRLLDYPALELKPFVRGTLIRWNGKFHRFVDPRQNLFQGIKSIVGPIGLAGDKWKLLSLQSKVCTGSVEELFQQPEGLTLDLLRWHGFSDAMIDRFFRPFFGGVFLERELVTSSRMFRFLFRMFAEGRAVLPALGMGAAPQQLAAQLPTESIRLNSPVARVAPGSVTLESGESLRAKAVVVATEVTAAARLLNLPAPKPGRAVTSLYFAANVSPLKEPILVLDAEGKGPINNLAVLSDAAPSYAPPGKALISVSVLGDPPEGDAALEQSVRRQLTEWHGDAVASWQHLRTSRIRNALPDQTAPALELAERSVTHSPGIYIAGDHRDNASINGAMHSGWRAAQAVAEGLG